MNVQGLVLLIGSSIAACSIGCSGKTALNEAAVPGSRVTVHTVSRKEYSPDITSFGSIVYTRKNDIASSVEGILQSIPWREGASVSKGTLLARMENIQLTINYEQAKAAYSSARASTLLTGEQYRDFRMQLESRFIALEKTDLELHQKEQQLELMRKELQDTETLYSVGGITGEQLRTTRFSLSSAEAEYEKLQKEKAIMLIGLRDSDILSAGYAIPQDTKEKRSLLIDLNSRTKNAELNLAKKQEETAKTQMTSAEALLKELTIYSPATGIVGAVYKETGERVEPGEKILTLIDSRAAWAVFPVNEKDLDRIQTGMRAQLHIEALGEESIDAVVDVISPTVDPQSGNVTVKALLENPENLVKPGMFVRVTVQTGNPSERIFIPQSCLAQRDEQKGVVITVRNKRIFQRNVQLGIEHRDEMEVTEGLQDGELVVVEPTPLLKEGDEVTVNEEK